MTGAEPHETFTRLLIQNEPEILRTVLVLVPNRADARDVLQECSVALWRHFGEYDPTRPFLNWALGFVRMEVRRYLRTTHRRAQLTARVAELLLDEEQRMRESLDTREQHLNSCLDALPADHRAVVDGYYREEQPIETLAARTGRTTDAVYKLLQRIRLALHRCIDSKLAGAGA